jgi:SAM-dependent methyltransferase
MRTAAPRQIFKLVLFCMRKLYGLQGRVFDRLLGVSTRDAVITSSSIFNTGGDNCPYAGSHWLPVRRALKRLVPGPADVFVDLGSGKGKALLIAGRLPYRRVVGVEIDEELSQCSNRNINNARYRLRAREVNAITANVLEWTIPDEASVIFMFNPFIGQTFHAAVDHIFESYDRKPRGLHIVYHYPWEHNWLLSTGRVIVDNVQPGIWPALPRWWQGGDVIVTYRVVGIPEGNKSRPLPRRLIRSHQAILRWSKPNSYRFTMPTPDGATFYSHS